MEFSVEKVPGSKAVGSRDVHPDGGNQSGQHKDYESFFKSFADKILKSPGAVLLDGKVLLEFVPKGYMKNERLISPETSFSLHEFAERSGYNDKSEKRQKNKNRAMESYNYQKNMKPLDVSYLEGFMPVI
ncbi:MAG: hypothetical protein K0R98_574 [Rickettsiaceae bacterium]|nr:hypothetical protein [Rickettsiaceae bacterium]